MSNKLIVFMIDGLAAEHYSSLKHRLPNIAGLESKGFSVGKLGSEAFGISLSGRTSMLTGQPAAVSGVYGNRLWDGEQFSYANPDDIRVPTIPALAKAAGKKVAAIGAGMIRPEDVDLMVPPYWVDGWSIQRARDWTPSPAEAPWLRVHESAPTPGFVAMCQANGLPITYPIKDEKYQTGWELMCDQLIADWVGHLAASDQGFDLIWAEFCLPDQIYHYSGYKSPLSDWITTEADMGIGRLINQLEKAGVADEWNIAIMSDHGFGPIEKTLYFQNICPGVEHDNAGCCLVVRTEDELVLSEVAYKLGEHGVVSLPNDCFPEEDRQALHLFGAPEGVSFESTETDAVSGMPVAIATHGYPPGSEIDTRMCVIAGPDVTPGRVEAATAVQVGPTLAKVLGLPLDNFPGSALF